MAKISTPITDSQQGSKQVGFFYATVKDIKAEEKESKKGNKYTSLILDLEVTDGRDQKLFFNLPWDAWDQADGSVSLFKQFKSATKLTTEQLNETNNYKKQNIGITIGAVKDWQGVWKTFINNKTGKPSFSYGITGIYDYTTPDDVIEKLNEAETSKLQIAKQEKNKPETQPGFAKTELDDEMNF